MMILSTEKKIISKESIKKLVANKKDITLSENAIDEIIDILEKKAKIISKYAVERAKKKNRETILKEDIEAYLFESGD
ncbi:MAG: NFYB/HAP3 family transcription factor subunit [Candidatus Marsarchaeota archaeon]|jgi:histone H3/H4|nr:NFYB/HAP3 family transcription factor subunit [Candidatus Marsarchaeota archaeon]